MIGKYSHFCEQILRVDSPGIKPHFAALTVNVIYGLNFVIAKEVMPAYIKPSGFILLRVTCALLLFWAILLVNGHWKVNRKDIPLLVACGFFGVALNQLLFFIGLNLSSSVNGAIIMTSTPVIVVIMAAIFIRERITGWKGLGIGLGAGGAIFLILHSRGNLYTGGDAWLGNILIFINAASYAVYMVISKPLMKKYKPVTVISYVFLFGWMFVLPAGWQEFREIRWETFPAEVWWKVGYIILGVTFITYLFNIYALKYLDASMVSFYIYCQPVMAAFHAVLTGSDTLDAIMTGCCIMIFTGVYLVSIKPGESPATRIQRLLKPRT